MSTWETSAVRPERTGAVVSGSGNSSRNHRTDVVSVVKKAIIISAANAPPSAVGCAQSLAV